MNFEEYQKKAISTAIYPEKYRIIYPTLGLCGEAGEVAEKVKKSIRDGIDIYEDIVKELGDVLWYIANLSYDLGISLDHIAQTNIEKLASRKSRNKLQGSGDNR